MGSLTFFRNETTTQTRVIMRIKPEALLEALKSSIARFDEARTQVNQHNQAVIRDYATVLANSITKYNQEQIKAIPKVKVIFGNISAKQRALAQWESTVPEKDSPDGDPYFVISEDEFRFLQSDDFAVEEAHILHVKHNLS